MTDNAPRLRPIGVDDIPSLLAVDRAFGPKPAWLMCDYRRAMRPESRISGTMIECLGAPGAAILCERRRDASWFHRLLIHPEWPTAAGVLLAHVYGIESELRIVLPSSAIEYIKLLTFDGWRQAKIGGGMYKMTWAKNRGVSNRRA